MALSVDAARRIALDDSLSAHPVGQTVVVGCGNLLRGDDAVGPILIRHLWEEGVPDEITIVDVNDPVELGHVARSFDSCLVCTVHAYDGKTGKELSKFVINGMV